MGKAMSTFSDDTKLSAAPEQLSSKLGGEMAILNLQSGVYFGLNSVGARVWELIQTSKTVGAIRDAILSEFDVTADIAQRDLQNLLVQMRDHGMIQLAPQRSR